MSTEQEQTDKLIKTLTGCIRRALGPSIQSHSLPDHLTVFQEDGKGNTHQLLLSITYIGELGTSYHHNSHDLDSGHWSFNECQDSGMHLTSCDNNGYCNFCGHQ